LLELGGAYSLLMLYNIVLIESSAVVNVQNVAAAAVVDEEAIPLLRGKIHQD